MSSFERNVTASMFFQHTCIFNFDVYNLKTKNTTGRKRGTFLLNGSCYFVLFRTVSNWTTEREKEKYVWVKEWLRKKDGSVYNISGRIFLVLLTTQISF